MCPLTYILFGGKDDEGEAVKSSGTADYENLYFRQDFELFRYSVQHIQDKADDNTTLRCKRESVIHRQLD